MTRILWHYPSSTIWSHPSWWRRTDNENGPFVRPRAYYHNYRYCHDCESEKIDVLRTASLAFLARRSKHVGRFKEELNDLRTYYNNNTIPNAISVQCKEQSVGPSIVFNVSAVTFKFLKRIPRKPLYSTSMLCIVIRVIITIIYSTHSTSLTFCFLFLREHYTIFFLYYTQFHW